MNDAEVEDQLEQFKDDDDSRLDSVADDEPEFDAFVETIVDELAAIDRGEKQQTASIWDRELAALFQALDEHDDVTNDLAQSLHDELGRDGDVGAADRSGVLKDAIRLGLREASEEHVERWMDAKAEAARQL